MRRSCSPCSVTLSSSLRCAEFQTTLEPSRYRTRSRRFLDSFPPGRRPLGSEAGCRADYQGIGRSDVPPGCRRWIGLLNVFPSGSCPGSIVDIRKVVQAHSCCKQDACPSEPGVATPPPLASRLAESTQERLNFPLDHTHWVAFVHAQHTQGSD